MRIDRIHIDGFGRFADYSVGPFHDGVTVFLGRNEAGKSTFLSFIRAVLFGFPSRRGREHYPPLAGGSHGGSITIADRDGQLYVVRRMQGTGVGPVTVSSTSSEPLNEAVLGHLLGSHSGDVFKKVFAFTLDELHSDELLRDSSVNGQMYSTGMGASALPDALKMLNQDREKLFLNRGSSQEIYRVANELDGIDSRLREVAESAGEYGRLRTRLEEVSAAIKRKSGERRTHLSELDHQNRLKNAWDDWNNLVSMDRELRELPVIEAFPSDGVARLEALQERLNAARRERDEAKEHLEDAKSRLIVNVKNREILECSDIVQRIERGRDGFDQSVHDLPERETELRNDRELLADTLSDLGSDWDKDRLESFDMSLGVQQEIEGFRDDIARSTLEAQQADSDSRRAESELNDAIDDVKRRQNDLKSVVKPKLDESEIDKHRLLIRTANNDFDALARAKDRQSDFEISIVDAPVAQSAKPLAKGVTLISSLMATVGLVLLVGAFAFAEDAARYGGSGIGGVLTIMGVVYFVVNRQTQTTHNEISGTEEKDRASMLRMDVERVESRISEYAVELGVDIVDERSLVNAEADLNSQKSRLDEWLRLERALKDSESLKSRREQAKSETADKLTLARQKVESANQAWREWLRNAGLRDTFTPETARELHAKVEQGKDRLRVLRDREHRVGAIKEDIREHRELVGLLAGKFEISLDDDDSSVGSAADRLKEIYDDAVEKVREEESAREGFDRTERQLAARENELADADSEVTKLLEAGGAVDAEEFRRRHEVFENRNELHRQKRESLRRLQRLSGPGEALESLKRELEASTAESIDDEIRVLSERASDTDSQINELFNEQGSLRSRVDGLMGEEESSGLRLDRNVRLEQMRDYARKWSTYTMAMNLLKETRLKFERERQPSVIQHAEGFFREITDGRYSGVYAPLGEHRITVTDYDDRRKSPSELSRGTREQLFLSLRFGLIRELGERTERLPVIVDEVLVNFDPDRALRTASAFLDLSKTNQVLVFTCHPSVVDLFKDAARKAGAESPKVIELDDEGLSL